PRGVSEPRRASGHPREGPQGEAPPEAARGGGPDHREPERKPEPLVHAARRRRALLRWLRLRRPRGGIPLGEDPSRRSGGAAPAQESAATLPPQPEPRSPAEVGPGAEMLRTERRLDPVGPPEARRGSAGGGHSPAIQGDAVRTAEEAAKTEEEGKEANGRHRSGRD